MCLHVKNRLWQAILASFLIANANQPTMAFAMSEWKEISAAITILSPTILNTYSEYVYVEISAWHAFSCSLFHTLRAQCCPNVVSSLGILIKSSMPTCKKYCLAELVEVWESRPVSWLAGGRTSQENGPDSQTSTISAQQYFLPPLREVGRPSLEQNKATRRYAHRSQRLTTKNNQKIIFFQNP